MNTECVKKTFRAPELTVYGDIRTITKTVGTISDKRDSQGGSPNKTA